MADNNVIKEFLVGLGFKVDEKGLKKFNEGIAGATKSVLALVAGIEGATLAIGAAVAKFATNMEALYFASQRTGASAANLKAADLAAQNLGASAGAAVRAIEGIAKFMRDNPGGEGWLKSLGIQTRDAKGNLRDTSDILVSLGQKLKDMPWYQAKAYGQVLGIDDDTLRAIMSGDFAAQLENQRRILKDSGYEDATRAAREFQQRMRELEARFDAIKVKVGNGLLKVLQPELDSFAKWFEEHSDDITKFVSTFANAIVGLSKIITPILGKIADGWRNIYDWVKAAGEKINEIMPESVSDKIGAGTAWLLDKLGIKGAVDDMLFGPGGGSTPAPSAAPATSSSDPRGIRNNNPGNLNYAGQEGATKEGGSNGRFAVFKTAEEGLKALGSQLLRYGQRGLDSVQAIISKYAPASENNTQAYMEALAKSLGVGINDKLNLNDPKILSALMNGIIQHENGKNPYRPDMVASAAGSAIAGRGAQVSQTTNITVSGVSDPAAAGRAVANEQARVNANLTRNMRAAYQ